MESEPREAGGVRAFVRARWILCLLALILGLSLPALVHPYYEANDETNDASIYLLTTKALLAGEGYSYLGAPFTIRPPGFSLLIAPVIASFGVDFYALNLFVSLCGALGILCLFVLLEARIGALLAFLLALVLWFNPGFRQMSNQVMSDVPGTACMLACLVIERWCARKPSAARDILLGVCIGAAAYVRSINVLLAPAIVVVRCWTMLRRPKSERSWSAADIRHVLAPAICAVLMLVPWNLRNSFRHPEAPVDQNFLYSYSTAMWHVDGGDPSSPRRSAGDIVKRIPTRTEQVTSALGARLGNPSESAVHVALGVALLLATLGLFVLRRRASECFVCGAVGVLLVYFGFRERLVLPILVLSLPAAVELSLWGGSRWVGERVTRWVLAAMIVALGAIDFAPRTGWGEIERVHRIYVDLAAKVAEHLPREARLAAPIGWHYSVYLDRPVYSLFFATRRKGDMSGAEEAIDKYRVDTVLLVDFTPADAQVLPYFKQRYGVRDQIGPAALVRVRD